MKRLFFVLLAAAFGMVLVACNETTTVATTENQTTTETVTTTEDVTTTETPTTTQAPTTVMDADLADMYEGSHEVSAMGSTVTYYYFITFSEGVYVFHSNFEMGGESYSFDETGAYAVSGNDLTLTPAEGDPVNGTIADGEITISVQASSMASRVEQTLTEVVVERMYVGTHTVSAMGSEVVYQYIMKFAYGMYSFHSEFEMGGEAYSYDESGTYTASGTALAITPEGGSEVTGTIGDGTIEIAVQASAMASRETRTLEASALALHYEGTHTVSAMGSDVIYVYTITFAFGEYSFHSDFEMSGTAYTYDETGTYVVSDGVITMTPEGESAVTGSVLIDGSIEIPIKASSMASRGLQTLTEVIPVVETTE